MDIDGNIYCPRCMRKLTETDPAVSVCPRCGRDPAARHPAMALDSGTLLSGRYQLGDVIGQGGFGITYAAWDETLGMPVAVKEYFPREEAARDPEESDDVTPLPGKEALFADGLSRFRRESHLLASLQGIPCVVKVLDYFGENGTAYIVMEFVHGKPIDQWAKENRVKPDELLHRLRPVFDALVRTHSQGVIHRDITPDNLLVEEDGSLKLIDFGSAVEVKSSAGTVVLTRKYAPVEQYGRDFGQQGPWTDVYGLAAVLYALISGEEPVEAPLRAHKDEMKPLARRHTGLKKYQAAAVDGALTVSPEKRTQSMAEFRSRLYHLPMPEEVLRRRRFMRRVAAVSLALAAVLAAVILNFTTGLPIGRGLLGSFRGNGVYIVRHFREEEERKIPDSVLGLPVSAIGADAFRGDETLRRVEIPGTVREIGDQAFYGCENLEEVTVAEGAATVGLSAFGVCNQLVSLTLPDTVTDIGEAALPAGAPTLTVWGSRGTAAEKYAEENELRFSDAAELTWEITDGEATLTGISTDAERLTLPNHVDGVPVTAVKQGICLSAQKTVWLPEYLSVIPDSLFYDKKTGSALAQIRLGAHVREIGKDAFCHSKITKIDLPDTLEIIGEEAFYRSSLSDVALPSGLREIRKFAFRSSNVKKIKIPDNIEQIGSYAFSSIEGLTELNLPEHLRAIPSSAFQGIDLETLLLPEDVKNIGDNAFSYCGFRWLILPEGAETIGRQAFSYNSKLQYIQIPDTVTEIDDFAFTGCSADLTIAGHAGSYAEAYAQKYGIAFENADQWTAPELLAGRTAYYLTAEDAAVRVPFYNEAQGCLVDRVDFNGNTAVEEAILSPYVTEIDYRGFSGCTALRSVQTAGRLLTVGDQAFAGCSALEEIPLENVTRIGIEAFMGCAALKEMNLPNAEWIDTGAFQDCTGLKTVSLGSGRLLEIPMFAFDGCTALERMTLPNQVHLIDAYAFKNCTALTAAELPSQLHTIKMDAFRGCESLASVTLPELLLTIESGAFQGCGALSWVVLPGSLQELSDSAFRDCGGLKLVVTASGSTASGFSCGNCTSLKAVYYADTTPALYYGWLEGCDAVTDLWFYNPDMNIASTGIADPRKLTVHGYAGSTAESWAAKNKAHFAPIPDGEPMPDPERIIAGFDFSE